MFCVCNSLAVSLLGGNSIQKFLFFIRSIMDPYFEMYFGVHHWTGEQRGGVFSFFLIDSFNFPRDLQLILALKRASTAPYRVEKFEERTNE